MVICNPFLIVTSFTIEFNQLRFILKSFTSVPAGQSLLLLSSSGCFGQVKTRDLLLVRFPDFDNDATVQDHDGSEGQKEPCQARVDCKPWHD